MILNWCSIAAIVRGRGGHRGRGSCHFQFATSHAFLIIQWLCIVRHFGLFRYQLNLMTVPMFHVGFMLISLRGQLGLLSTKRRLAVESNSDCWSAPSCVSMSANCTRFYHALHFHFCLNLFRFLNLPIASIIEIKQRGARCWRWRRPSVNLISTNLSYELSKSNYLQLEKFFQHSTKFIFQIADLCSFLPTNIAN